MFTPLRIFVCSVVFGSALNAWATESGWDHGWRFHLGEAVGAEAPDWNDADWHLVTLPHDWSIEGATHPDAPALGAGGFFRTGIGWYRRSFAAPAAWSAKKVWIEFDGVYRDSEVWVNGTSLGRRPGGHYPFRYELTPHLLSGKTNVLAVRVDNSAQPNSRYYTGSGINRHVRLLVLDPVHVEPDSLALTTESLTARSAQVRVQAVLKNDSSDATPVAFSIALKADATSQARGSATGTIPAHGELAVDLLLEVPNPRPWSPDAPTLYRVAFQLKQGRTTVDEGSLAFGVRTVRVSAERGFELNGIPLKLMGGNVHTDNGPLGTAAFDRAEARRAELINAAGFNAVRIAHNPPAPAFLDACDRLGLLVLEEFFDGWKSKKVAQDYGRNFDAWWERDLTATLRRDRNHPSVVTWDIGNEPYERGNARGAAIARALADRVRSLDSSRPVTAGINGLGRDVAWAGADPVLAPLDVAGYNYEIAHHTDDHVRLPQRVIMVTESYQSEIFANWRIVQQSPYVIGDFVWSALDYLGEAGIGRVFLPDEAVQPHWVGTHYPWHGGATGDLDLIGTRRPLSHYRNIVWDRGERLYAAVAVPTPDGRPWNLSLWAPPPLAAHWTWPGQEGKNLSVEVYSRHESVRLYLNDRLLGEQPTTVTQEFKTVFTVPYQPGALRAVGVSGGREIETFTLTTAGAPDRIRLTADRTTLRADSQDLAFVLVEVVDASGRIVPDASATIAYQFTGPARIAAVGSADLTSTASYQDNPRAAFEGRALVVLRTLQKPGKVTLTATASGLKPATLTLRTTHP